jgi:hypothetical protein
MTILRPCPLCGREVTGPDYFNDGHGRYAIRCIPCGLTIEVLVLVNGEFPARVPNLSKDEYRKADVAAFAECVNRWNRRYIA